MSQTAVIERPTTASGAAANSQRLFMTYEEYLDWLSDTTHAEWENGEVIMTTPATFGHQDLGSFLETTLRLFVEARNLGQVVRAPFVVKPIQNNPAREPDIFFLAGQVLAPDDTELKAPPDLAIEIASPGTRGRDRGVKFYEYEEAGVREYWLLDSQRRQADIYQLDMDGKYVSIFSGSEGLYRSEILPDFWLRIEWLWELPLPSAIATVAEIAGPGAIVTPVIIKWGPQRGVQELIAALGPEQTAQELIAALGHEQATDQILDAVGEEAMLARLSQRLGKETLLRLLAGPSPAGQP